MSICIALKLPVSLSENVRRFIFRLICIPAPKREHPPITSCSCRVIVAGFINKTFSRLSFLHVFPKPVIIFNDKGAAWPQENLMTKAARLLPSSSNAV